MTDAQIERGDCDIPEEEPEEEVIIVVDEEQYDTKEELPDDDDVVLEVELEDEMEELEPIKKKILLKRKLRLMLRNLKKSLSLKKKNLY